MTEKVNRKELSVRPHHQCIYLTLKKYGSYYPTLLVHWCYLCHGLSPFAGGSYFFWRCTDKTQFLLRRTFGESLWSNRAEYISPYIREKRCVIRSWWKITTFCNATTSFLSWGLFSRFRLHFDFALWWSEMHFCHISKLFFIPFRPGDLTLKKKWKN